jgi:hypothetical protein
MENLFKYQDPKSVFRKILQLSHDDEFMFKKKFEKAREAWSMACFSIGYMELMQVKCEIKMSTDDPADAKMKLLEDEVDYQIVEVLNEGRKRDSEYRDWIKRGKPLEVRPYYPIEFKKAIELVGKALSAKLNKRYSVGNKLNLLIYLDFDRNSIYLDKLFEALYRPDISPFSEIWLFGHAIVDYKGGYAIARLLPDKYGFFVYEINEN